MPYSSEHKTKSRLRIIASAYKLFSAKGYDNVSINEIMAKAKMTHGAFYAHFKSKSVLYHEAIKHAAETSEITKQKPDDIDGKSWIQELLTGYLHKNNITSRSCSCPLASLVTDVVVREPRVRKTYTNTFKGMNDIIAKYTNTFSNCSTDIILATSAMVVGGLAIARALDDVNLAEQLLENCKSEALRLLNANKDF